MSDSKKPTVSEIRSRACFLNYQVRRDMNSLLDLVERMGRIIRDDVNPISEIDTIRVRALLKEIKL